MNQLEEIYPKCLETILSSARKYLDQQHELDAAVAEDYDFGRKKWVAAYVADSVFSGTIEVGINKPVLFKWVSEHASPQNYELELTAQIGVSVWHEIGHALIQYYQDLYENDEDFRNACDKYMRVLRPAAFIKKYEEDNVEEFGEYMMRSTTGQYNSMLYDALELLARLSSGEE